MTKTRLLEVGLLAIALTACGNETNESDGGDGGLMDCRSGAACEAGWMCAMSTSGAFECAPDPTEDSGTGGEMPPAEDCRNDSIGCSDGFVCTEDAVGEYGCTPEAMDAGSMDAGSMDAGSMDAGSMDAGSMDAGSMDAGSMDGGPITIDFDGICPPLHVCGSGVPVQCEATVEFVGDPDDDACTPVAYCPEGAVCGTGLAVECDPATDFAADPTHEACTPTGQCPVPLCEQDGAMVCSAQCIRAAFRLDADSAPTRQRPWAPNRDEQLVALGQEDANTLRALSSTPLLVPFHPAHVSVPGRLPRNIEPISQTVTVDATGIARPDSYGYSNPREPLWRSTGTYAIPGTVFTVEVPPDAVNARPTGLMVQVGSHTDRDNVWAFPYNQPIRRFPDVVHMAPIERRVTAMASAFGGMVYIRVSPSTDLGPIEIKITGVVRAGSYVHGVTDPVEWQQQIEDHPVPIAELVGDKIILTVRTADLAGIDPAPLMAFWTRAMDAVWYLSGIPEGGERPERIVADPAIEGIAHSGYPIAMAELWTYALVDISEIRENQWWTTFHELGHNFQLAEWTFTGLTEATCNLWALHVLESVGMVARADTHPGQEMSAASRRARIETWIAEGRDFEGNWQQGFNAYQGFIPLELFMQLQEGFGWDYLHVLNSIYRELPQVQRPRADSDRIQQWVRRSSEAVGVNLGDFYRDWGFPISDETQAIISMLPDWLENPMDGFE